MLSIVVPTMWRFEPFAEYIRDVAGLSCVGEVIIINNNVEDTPHSFKYFPHPKIKLINQEQNIYVNPAWNLGVTLAENENVCIINDDIIGDLRIFVKANRYLTEIEDIRYLAVSPNVTELGQPPLTTGEIEIRQLIRNDGVSVFGFGAFFFVKKSKWFTIPSELKVWCGDSYLIEKYLRTNNVFYIFNALTKTTYNTTVNTVDIGDFLPREQEVYRQLEEKGFPDV